MDRSFRYRIFAAMMGFARHVDFRYHCLVVDKKDVTSSGQIVKRLGEDLSGFLSEHRKELSEFDRGLNGDKSHLAEGNGSRGWRGGLVVTFEKLNFTTL